METAGEDPVVLGLGGLRSVVEAGGISGIVALGVPFSVTIGLCLRKSASSGDRIGLCVRGVGIIRIAGTTGAVTTPAGLVGGIKGNPVGLADPLGKGTIWKMVNVAVFTADKLNGGKS